MADDIVAQRVRIALGAKYDPKATYRLVRPEMVGLPKFAGDEVVGEFAEDTRSGTRLVILRRAAPPDRTVGAAERVRSMIAGKKK